HCSRPHWCSRVASPANPRDAEEFMQVSSHWHQRDRAASEADKRPAEMASAGLIPYRPDRNQESGTPAVVVARPPGFAQSGSTTATAVARPGQVGSDRCGRVEAADSRGDRLPLEGAAVTGYRHDLGATLD